MIAARWASIGVSVLSILLAVFAQSLNVAFLVSLAFAVAASANLPLIIFTVFWKRFNAAGALAGSLTGLLSALILVSISPSVWDPAGNAIFVGDPLIPLSNPGIISIPLGFLGAYLGTILSSKPLVKTRLQKFRSKRIQASTWINLKPCAAEKTYEPAGP